MERLVQTCGYPRDMERRVVGEITEVLRKVPNMRVTTVVALNESRMCSLCALEGTLPTTSRYKPLSLPIRLILPVDFPTQAPLCYFLPTDSLSILPSRMLDSTLRIKHPALSSWAPSSSLTTLLAILTQAFQKQCPVEPVTNPVFNPYLVTINQVNEKIMGLADHLGREVMREIAGLKQTLALLNTRKEALKKGEIRYKDTTMKLQNRIKSLHFELNRLQKFSSKQHQLLDSADRVYTAIQPESPKPRVIIKNTVKTLALEDTIALLERKIHARDRVRYSDLRVYREVTYDYFLECRKTERIMSET